MAVTGNSVIRTTSGGGGTRDIGATSALDSAGLMGNGDTLWFSFIVNKPASGNANVDFNFSLGTAGFADYGSGEFAQRVSLDSGEGIGFALTNRNATQMDVEGAYWQDDGGGGFSERNLNEAFNRWTGPTMLVVGRIDWGANGTADESLTLYTPDTNLNQGSARLAWTNIPALDQSAFDTIAFQLKGGGNIDEIRFGSSYADVTPVPEPSGLLLGAAGGLLLLRRRR